MSDDLLAALHTKERILHQHKFVRGRCVCGKSKDLTKARVARTNRQRGKAAEREAADMFGGEVVGGLNGPDDVRGTEWLSQVKSHQTAPPGWLLAPKALVVASQQATNLYAWVWTEFPRAGHLVKAPPRWTAIFENMVVRPKTHRLLERYARPGHKAQWWVVREVGGRRIFPDALALVAFEVIPGLDWVAEYGRDDL